MWGFYYIISVAKNKELIDVNSYNWIQIRFVRKNIFIMEMCMYIRGKNMLYFECMKIKL